MILINGENHAQIAISDRGFQYGDGLFETIEVLNGRLILIEQHLQRLNFGCEKLLIPPPDKQLLLNEAAKITQNLSHGVLKIIITRGSGGRGYKPPDNIQPTRVLSLHPFPDYSPTFQKEGIVARFCQQRLGLNPTLAGLKHLNRLEQVLARAEWNTPEIQEGLMLDLNGHVIEGTMSNVFFVKNNILYTPSLRQAGIAGIMRDFVLQTAQKSGIQVEQGTFSPEQLLEADELFVTNSIIGIWGIQSLASQSFIIGDITRMLQTRLAQFKQQTLSA
jgi:4-amino-4-deoxychorismate lyase